MPELPEVETVKETLKKRLIGKKIISTNVYYKGIIAIPNVTDFIDNINGQTIKGVTRRGKFLVFELNDYYLLSHLRMEGKYFFKDPKDKINKHEHVSFLLNDNIELRYMDTRKFGKMYLIEKEKINEIGPLKDLGLEPFDAKLNIEYLHNKLKNKSIPIKTTLLDQSIITGIGNIYADEILFLSNINPLKKSNKLNDQEIDNIIKNTSIILKKAIEKGGTTIHSYTSVDGVTGRFQNELLVHGKDNKECPNCHNTIIKIRVGGRGTYYCENCQK